MNDGQTVERVGASEVRFVCTDLGNVKWANVSIGTFTQRKSLELFVCCVVCRCTLLLLPSRVCQAQGEASATNESAVSGIKCHTLSLLFSLLYNGVLLKVTKQTNK